MDDNYKLNAISSGAYRHPVDSGFAFQRLTFGDLVIEGGWVKDAAAAKLLNQTMALASMRRPLRGPNDPMREFGPRYMLADEIKQHIRALKIEQVSTSHIHGVETSLEFLRHTAGNIPVNEITKAHILATFELIKRFPNNPRRQARFRGKSVAEILALTEGEDSEREPVALGTLSGRRGHLLAFFNSLMKEPDKLTINPVKAADLRFDTSRRGQSERVFSREDLAQIFDPANFEPWAKLPHRWWVPMLGLYTGARVDELAKLRQVDVSNAHGMWTLRFTSYGASTVKTSGSIREVPIAPALIEAGFLDYVADVKQTGHPRLFPHLARGKSRNTNKDNGRGYGVPMSIQFSDYTEKLQLAKGRTMHSFRHYLIDSLRRAGVHDTDIGKITGHEERGGANKHAKAIEIYQGDMTDVLAAEAAQILSKFKPPVNLIRYRPGQFASVLSDPREFNP